MSKNVLIKEELPFVYITLNRPDFGNAFDHQMASDIASAFKSLKGRRDVYAVIMDGAGNNFCSGVDLRWMSRASSLTPEENIKDMAILKVMYDAILDLACPLVVVAKGQIRGGGIGILACGDIVLAEDGTNFALSEARWGLIPGIVTPMVIDKIGPSAYLELALSTREFEVDEAKLLGLVHHAEKKEFLPVRLDAVKNFLQSNNIDSMFMIKKNVREMYIQPQDLLQTFLELSAVCRMSEEFKDKVEMMLPD